MKKTLLVVATLLAATSVSAREPNKKKTEPPPPPAVEFEMDDAQFGDALGEACVAAPAEQETYDSRDNVLIVKTADGARVFLHFKGGCDTNTMIFAEKIAGEGDDACLSVGDALVFTSSYGDSKKCVVSRINKWLDEELIRPEDE
jgi:hypothetical protein